MSEVLLKSSYLRRIRVQQTARQPKILHYDPLTKDLRVWFWYVRLPDYRVLVVLISFS